MPMKQKLLAIVSSIMMMILCSCQGIKSVPTKPSQPTTKQVIEARITFYSAHEDKWGSRVACQETKRATQGVTVAAHPDFDFGTKLIIPELKNVVGDDDVFIVQDRGSAVTKKKASKGGAYVFDVFVQSNKQKNYLAKKLPEYMSVRVL